MSELLLSSVCLFGGKKIQFNDWEAWIYLELIFQQGFMSQSKCWESNFIILSFGFFVCWQIKTISSIWKPPDVHVLNEKDQMIQWKVQSNKLFPSSLASFGVLLQCSTWTIRSYLSRDSNVNKGVYCPQLQVSWSQSLKSSKSPDFLLLNKMHFILFPQISIVFKFQLGIDSSTCIFIRRYILIWSFLQNSFDIKHEVKVYFNTKGNVKVFIRFKNLLVLLRHFLE